LSSNPSTIKEKKKESKDGPMHGEINDKGSMVKCQRPNTGDEELGM
jgi:hypothetical protein